MPAKSQKQQKFFGAVRAVQKGDISANAMSGPIAKAARDMSPQDVKDFASTKHKGLPEKVKAKKRVTKRSGGKKRVTKRIGR